MDAHENVFVGEGGAGLGGEEDKRVTADPSASCSCGRWHSMAINKRSSAARDSRWTSLLLTALLCLF